MKSNVQVNAGICGLCTRIAAISEDGQTVCFQITTDCDKVRRLADRLSAAGPLDAYRELGAGNEGVILRLSRDTMHGCCAACAVSISVFKAMQVAAGLALPKDVEICITKEQP